MHLSQLLCLRRRRLRKPPSADSRKPPPPPSRPSPNLSASQQHSTEHPPISKVQDDSVNKPGYASVVPEHSNPTPAPTPDPHGSSAQPLTHPPQPSSSFDPPGEHHALLAVPQQPQANPTASHEHLLSQQLTEHPLQPQDGSPDIHNVVTQNNYVESRNISVNGNMNHINYNYIGTVVNDSNDFMKELLERTIPGAAFDSSSRDPPPRCHPRTRLDTLERCLYFITNCSNKKKTRWVVGAAGVGKSAIMQTVAEHPLPSVALRASIFFFVDGRSDGSKAIATLAYQLAVQCDSYRQFVRHEIAHDPSLLSKSISVQFNKFIVQPFIHHPQLNSAGRVLIIIDGLDECDKPHTQRELLQLITDFCLTYPSSPIVWMISSRPDLHITSFFAQASVEEAYEKEEIRVDSYEARTDVEKFLRTSLEKIQNDFLLHPRKQWPSIQDIWKLVLASGGLFIYAQTIVKYIGDPDIGDPTTQLREIVDAIDAHPLPNGPSEEHPMAFLDVLYSRILSRIPNKVMKNTRKLLLALIVEAPDPSNPRDRIKTSFMMLCNWLSMTSDEAYAAIHPLSSVLDVPRRDNAHKVPLRHFHKSFLDYISDFSRSGFSRDITHEAHELHAQCTSRILEQAPDGINISPNANYEAHLDGSLIGTLTCGPGTGRNVLIAWPSDSEEGDWYDNRARLTIYKMAITSVVDRLRRGEQAYCSEPYIRLLATSFQYFDVFGIPGLYEAAFDKSRRHEFMEKGLIQHIPIEKLNPAKFSDHFYLHFRRPATPALNLPDPWNLSYCRHEREGKWEEGNDLYWSTASMRETKNLKFGYKCVHCMIRLEKQLEDWKSNLFPDHPVSVLFTSTDETLVELVMVDPEDGVSEWTYWLRQRHLQI